MERVTIGWLCILVLFLLLPTGIPIAIIMLAVGIFGYLILEGFSPTFGILSMVPFSEIAHYTFTVIPLFILMGHLAYSTGLAGDLFQTTRAWVGRIPGGLVHAVVTGCALFGAMCGSGMATAATMAKIAVPEMTKMGVDKKLALGSVAAAGTLAAMIPPSIIMVVYGIIVEESVGKLLIAGILPGIVAALNFMIMIFIRAKLNPQLVPSTGHIPWKEKFVALKNVWPILLVIACVMGGIYGGVFTPTEAGGLGAFSVLAVGLILRRLTLSGLKDASVSTIKTSGMIFLIIIAAFIFTRTLNVSGVTNHITSLVSGLEVNRYIILGGIMLLYIFLGTFMDFMPAMFMTLPIIYPLILSLGFNSIWFGVLIVHLDEISMITPPFGLNLFVIQGVIPDAKMGDIIRGMLPFILVDIVTLGIFIAFPQIALFLPSLM